MTHFQSVIGRLWIEFATGQFISSQIKSMLALDISDEIKWYQVTYVVGRLERFCDQHKANFQIFERQHDLVANICSFVQNEFSNTFIRACWIELLRAIKLIVYKKFLYVMPGVKFYYDDFS